MDPDTRFAHIGEELESVLSTLRRDRIDGDDYAEAASSLREIYRSLYRDLDEESVLVDRLQEVLLDQFIPLLREELASAIAETYVHRYQTSQDRRRAITELRSEYEKSIRQDVWSQRETIIQQIQSELEQELRVELRNELTNPVREELRAEFAPAVLEELRAEIIAKLGL